MYGECRNFLIRRDFTSNGARLRKRFMGLGIFMLVLSPFLLIFMLCYFFLRNAEQFYHEPSTAGSRRWSNLAKWTFREFNEVCSCVLILPFLWWNLNYFSVDSHYAPIMLTWLRILLPQLEHMFRHRMNASYKHAVEYLKQFPSPIISMIAKFVSFVAGAFAAVLILIALIDESLVEGHVRCFRRTYFVEISIIVLQCIEEYLATCIFQVYSYWCLICVGDNR